jgi:hypothetical protein
MNKFTSVVCAQDALRRICVAVMPALSAACTPVCLRCALSASAWLRCLALFAASSQQLHLPLLLRSLRSLPCFLLLFHTLLVSGLSGRLCFLLNSVSAALLILFADHAGPQLPTSDLEHIVVKSEVEMYWLPLLF